MLMRIAAMALALILGATLAHAGQDVTPAQVDALKKRIANIDKWLVSAERSRSDLEKQLVANERRISELTRERRNLRAQADEQQQQLTELQKQENELATTLEQQREGLKKQIRAAWMEGDAPALKILLNEIEPGMIARTMTYYEYLSRDTVGRLEAFQASLRELRAARAAVQTSRVELAKTEASLEQRQQQLADTRKEREKTLTALNADIRNRRGERDDLDADRKRLEKLLEEVQQAIASIPAPNESRPFKSLRNNLPWPAKGRVVSNYGAAYAEGKLRRNGIIMNTQEDAEVKAIHYGRVVFANWLRGFGLMTIIDHGDGYLTLYGHSSSLFTAPGDWVAAGETVALAGRTGGTDDPAVYFEVRQNGKPVNPRSWLGKP
ncbi:peptidoglycan DD-metalloendopeptidase family protein [Marinobacter sp.]|uniref:murein hydrolase activator EnvC family protein n=1 Tax=Marinobacter sp. TaxID=50741 RepID=UPI001A0BF37E|nr:peptidoglycan DD-metalloendopeptidase family protein [Marinobacter sp.]MBE0486215.1 peptidoglycan DD-metalloendopeptidase family protein [Marinobacter sp.]